MEHASPLVGRDAEQAAVQAAVGPGAVVTLAGPGGVGKTRLALAALPGVPFCDLAPARTLDDVVPRVAEAVGISLLGTRDTAHALDRLTRFRGTAILDNAEQALDAVRAVCRALPEAALLVTSRRPLGLDGEHTMVLSGLAPAPALVLLGAPVDGPEAQAATALVAALDGLPLALELARSRLAWMPASEVLRQLDDPRLIARPGAEGRHAGLDRALAWSWGLLPPEQRAVLGQLALFEARFTFADAARVVHVPEVFLPDALPALVDAALVAQRGDGFALLQTVRRFVRSRSPAVADAAARHAAWAVEGPDMHAMDGPNRRAAWATLSARVADLLAVLERDPERAPRAALRLDAWADECAPGQRHLDLLELGFAGRPTPAERSRLLWARAATRRRTGDAAGARRDLLDGLECADPRAAVSMRVLLGILALDAGDLAEADAHLDDAEGHAAGAEPSATAGLQAARAMTARYRGSHEEARRRLDAAIRDCALADVPLREAHLRLQRCGLLLQLEDIHGAEVDVRAALERYATVGSERGQHQATFRLGMIHLHLTRLDAARACFLEVLEFARRTGDVALEIPALANLGSIGVEAGDASIATPAFREAIAAAARAGFSAEIQNMRVGLASGQLGWGEAEAGRALLREVLASPDTTPRVRLRARMWGLAAGALLGDGAAADALDATEGDGLDESDRAALDILRTLAPLGRGDGKAAAARIDGIRAAEGAGSARNVVRWALAHHPALAGRPVRLQRGVPEVTRPDGTRPAVPKRGLLARLLVALVDHRLDHPGEPLAPDALLEAGWPGERILPEAASNRVYVAMSRLRKAGLGDLIQARDGGYLLDPGVPVAPG